MKALTIKEPWASLIINGYKQYEFRTWKTNLRGKILIHASSSPDKKAIERFSEYNLDIKKGCIIGEAEITDCIKIDEDFQKELLKLDEKVYGNKKLGLYAFKLENVKKYDKVIPCKGRLSFWNYEERK